MAENIFAFLILSGLTTYCWLMVFKPRLRRRLGFRPPTPLGWFWGRVWPLKKQDRADIDAMSLASSLVGALLFSMITVVFLVVALCRYFAN